MMCARRAAANVPGPGMMYDVVNSAAVSPQRCRPSCTSDVSYCFLDSDDPIYITRRAFGTLVRKPAVVVHRRILSSWPRVVTILRK